jgi:hypothetical protein
LVNFFHISVVVNFSFFTFCGTQNVSFSLVLRKAIVLLTSNFVIYYLTVSVFTIADKNVAGGSPYYLIVSLSSSADRSFAGGSLFPPPSSFSHPFVISLSCWDGYLNFSLWLMKNVLFEQKQIKL